MLLLANPDIPLLAMAARYPSLAADPPSSEGIYIFIVPATLIDSPGPLRNKVPVTEFELHLVELLLQVSK